MLTLVAFIHIIVAVLIVVFVLLQDSKGGAMGGVLGGGGGSNSLFGSTGAGNFLVTITKWLAILFAITCIGLAYYSTQLRSSSVLDDYESSATPTNEVIDTTKASSEEKAAAPESNTPNGATTKESADQPKQ